ncbi:DUF4270 domain-containing protein [Mucilaginibacter daejeonensis]|uniref:DUF4270 family protein n=1 Tax=Mucilaginibacter daejeonensis TaxID=398049 RepID=UPI001D176594|nr:DUF4270 family protein [Mucilaginibacter daejeonensis]UEG54051.1 DUF4270 domain-containing protein [Mucilaginibacter daejeonensis]
MISLFILGGLASCKNQSDVGLPLGSQELSGTLLSYDDITIKTDTENTNLDVNAESSNGKMPLASFVDSRIGTTTSNVVTGITLPGNVAYTKPSGTVTTDSVVMELRYADGFYGDSLNSRYRVNVYQLTNKLQASTLDGYYSGQRRPHESANLINTAKAGPFNIRPKTSVKIQNILKGKADKDSLATPQLRVSLDPAFFASRVFNPTTTSSVANFQNSLKGLYISLQRNNTTETGGSAMLDITNCNIKVYYRADTAGTIDTNSVTLPFAGSVTEISHTYTDEVTKAMAAGVTSNDVFYIQGNAGLRAKIAFPSLKTIFGTTPISSIAINRAELVITPVAGTDVPFVPLPQLTLYRLDLTKQRRQIPDGAVTTGGQALDARFLGVPQFGGNYVKSTKDYHFLVTGYISDLIRGKTTDYGTYLGAIDTVNRNKGTTATVDYLPTAATSARLIAVGSNKSSQYKIKLNIIYTKNN